MIGDCMLIVESPRPGLRCCPVVDVPGLYCKKGGSCGTCAAVQGVARTGERRTRYSYLNGGGGGVHASGKRFELRRGTISDLVVYCLPLECTPRPWPVAVRAPPFNRARTCLTIHTFSTLLYEPLGIHWVSTTLALCTMLCCCQNSLLVLLSSPPSALRRRCDRP